MTRNICRFFCILACIVMLVGLISTAEAAAHVVFTDDSKFISGGKVTVDIMAMTDLDSAIYNAWLEHEVAYQWYLDGAKIPGATAQSYTVKEGDGGKALHVVVTCFDLVIPSQSTIITAITKPTTIPTTAPTTTPTTASTTLAPTVAPTDGPTPAAPTEAPSTAPNISVDQNGTDSSLLWLWIVIGVIAIGSVIFFVIFAKMKHNADSQ